LIAAAEALGCPLYLPQRDYHWQLGADGHWSWQGQGLSEPGAVPVELKLQSLPIPGLAIGNVASALNAALLIGLLPQVFANRDQWLRSVAGVLRELDTTVRQQWLPAKPGKARVMVDVAHNPHAALALAQRLQREKEKAAGPVSIHAVVAMMADKDHAGFYHALEKQVDFWYIAHFDLARCLPAATLAQRWQQLAADSSESAAPIAVFDTVAAACKAAEANADANDMIVVCGSFMTVADAIAARTEQ